MTLLATGLFSAALFLIGLARDSYWLRMITKPLPALLMAYWVITRPADAAYRSFVAAGLLLSAAGDALLEASPATFVHGLVAFLLAHLAYIAAFTRGARRLFAWRGLLVYAYGAVFYNALSRAGKMGRLARPVLVYIAVISTMLWRAASRDNPSPARAGLAGALLFAASDTILAINRFIRPLPAAEPAIIISYWLGQFGIALSVKRKI